jgi:hypothetical protein
MPTKKPFILSVKDEERHLALVVPPSLPVPRCTGLMSTYVTCTRACYGASGKVLLSRYARDFFLQLRVFIHGLYTHGLCSNCPLSTCDENRYSSLHRF